VEPETWKLVCRQVKTVRNSFFCRGHPVVFVKLKDNKTISGSVKHKNTFYFNDKIIYRCVWLQPETIPLSFNSVTPCVIPQQWTEQGDGLRLDRTYLIWINPYGGNNMKLQYSCVNFLLFRLYCLSSLFNNLSHVPITVHTHTLYVTHYKLVLHVSTKRPLPGMPGLHGVTICKNRCL
jgi:hypothetical protein